MCWCAVRKLLTHPGACRSHLVQVSDCRLPNSMLNCVLKTVWYIFADTHLYYFSWHHSFYGLYILLIFNTEDRISGSGVMWLITRKRTNMFTYQLNQNLWTAILSSVVLSSCVRLRCTLSLCMLFSYMIELTKGNLVKFHESILTDTYTGGVQCNIICEWNISMSCSGTHNQKDRHFFESSSMA